MKFNFCLKNKIKLIYSVTSASIKTMVLIKIFHLMHLQKLKSGVRELKKWFEFRYEVIYFYNVYGPNQICSGSMATVIGIFEDQYKQNKPLTVVKPGTQSRRFTHIEDTVKACFYAWKKK